MTNTDVNLHVLVPAAGLGQRFGGPVPKQYVQLCGKPIIQHSLEQLLAFLEKTTVSKSNQITIAISEDDDYWQSLEIAKDHRIKTVSGGKNRAESVQNALAGLSAASPDDWVLIHDAVRPLVTVKDMNRLVEKVLEYQASIAGGLLATPVYDTVKRANTDGEVIRTEDRDGLWVAQTPQMFRRSCLVKALETINRSGKESIEITDEASAVETAGHKVKLVSGSRTNIKITRPEDLEYAELFLERKD